MILIIDTLVECYRDASLRDEAYEYLTGLQTRHESLYLQNVITSIIEESQGKVAAQEYLSDKIKHQPSLDGLKKLISYKHEEIDSDKVFHDLISAITIMQKDSVEYTCQKCGFSSNTHYWLCPSCHRWGRVKPSVIELDHQ